MATFRSFEDIEAWRKARELARLVYRVSCESPFARDFVLRDQIRKAAISVVSNIAEGFERGGKDEFIQFLSYAKGSVGEIKAQLYIALDQGYLKGDEFETLCRVSEETARIIGGLMNYLRGSSLKGQKYKPRNPNSQTQNPKPGTRNSGFSLLSAIFLLVVLSALGTFMVVFSTVQHVASAQDLEGSRAYHAARSGIEFGTYQVLKAGAACAADPGSTKLADLSFSAASLGSFRATVVCNSSGPYNEGGNTVTIYKITSTACNAPVGGSCPGAAGGMNYVERQLTGTVGK